jgi:hypothetical protein
MSPRAEADASLNGAVMVRDRRSVGKEKNLEGEAGVHVYI